MDYSGNSYRRPWAYARYGLPSSSPDYFWGKLFSAFLEREEKTLYLLMGAVLVKVKFEGEKGSSYAGLACTVMERDGAEVPLEQRASASFEGRESPTPEEQQEVLRSALEKAGVPFGAITIVSDKYVEGHLKMVRLQQRIFANHKGA